MVLDKGKTGVGWVISTEGLFVEEVNRVYQVLI